MFSIGVLLLVASVCRECSGRFFTRHPDDTVAVTGHNVTLSCALNVVACAYPPDQGYIIYWNYQHEKTKKNYAITACSSPYKQFEKKYAVSSHELKWTLHIRNVEQVDGGDYWCTVFSYPDNVHYLSESATLTAILPIKTAVQPAQLSAAVGESAAFHCRPYRRHNSMVKYVWYINGTLQEEETVPSNLQLSESGQNLTILMLTETFNNTSITCGLLSGKVRLTRQRKRALLLVYRETERSVATLYTSTEMFPPSPSERQKEQDSRAVDLPKNPLSTGKYQVPSATTPATHGPKHSGTDPGHKSTPSLQSGNPSVILIGGVVAAVFLLLVIAFLLYFLLFHNRRKADANHARKTPRAQRRESGAAESLTSAETQLDLGDVAKACPQPTTAGTRLMEPPKQLTALEVTEDSKQHSSASKDQGKADESLAKDGANLNTDPLETEGKSHTMRGKRAEALYAMPDKQFLKPKATDSSQKANGQKTKKPKISGQKSRDDCQKPIIAVKLFSGPRRATTNQSSSDVKPPWVVPYHVAKGRAGAPSREAPEPVSDAQEESKNDDPGQRNVENLVYADLDLRGKDRGEAEGASIICTEEETLYADIVNKGTLGNLR